MLWAPNVERGPLGELGEDTSGHISSWKQCSHLACTPTRAVKASVVESSRCYSSAELEGILPSLQTLTDKNIKRNKASVSLKVRCVRLPRKPDSRFHVRPTA